MLPAPLMTLYFVASRLPVQAILGTAAWFFLLVNAFKVPFSVGLGLMGPQSLLLNLILVPAMIVRALRGRAVARRISPIWFERIVLLLTLTSGVYRLVRVTDAAEPSPACIRHHGASRSRHSPSWRCRTRIGSG